MSEKQSEVIKFNPEGPHFYVNDGMDFSFPEKWRDAITDEMGELIQQVDEKNPAWEVTFEHIKSHEPITTVEWDEEGFDIQPIELSLDWYSRERIHSWDHFNF